MQFKGVKMKKICILFLSVFLVLSCDNILDTARVTISVPPGVSKLHLAVFENTISEENLLTLESFGPSYNIIFDVPSGNDRIFLAVAENSEGLAFRAGSNFEPINLEPGQRTQVNFEVKTINLNFWIESLAHWDPVLGTTSYRLIRNNPPFSYKFSTIYEGTETSYADVVSGGNFPITYKVAGYYSYFDIYTVWSEFDF